MVRIRKSVCVLSHNVKFPMAKGRIGTKFLLKLSAGYREKIKYKCEQITIQLVQKSGDLSFYFNSVISQLLALRHYNQSHVF